ncbi:DUF4167 domain-containing protein [Erythrobacter sp. MTPC3]|uniref:DUF4167 domain-containing protein n=1 Tax=Erythrobacter sp. MTPC3 TaxID=3056564 RepID=UPI0036F1D075
MNNNRNNRRRGRGNRNQSGGGGNQINRIDSRARGNAPQLLDKYKKLAQDAQHNGDRVQAEYYLQFADHYFRVIADNKARQDEARAKRNDDRGPSGEDGDDEDGDNRRRNNRRSRPRHDDAGNSASNDSRDDAGEDEASNENTSDDAEQPKRRARKPRRDTQNDGEGEPSAKPRARKPRVKKSEAAPAAEIDSSVLPPAIGGAALSDKDSDDNLEAVG